MKQMEWDWSPPSVQDAAAVCEVDKAQYFRFSEGEMECEIDGQAGSALVMQEFLQIYLIFKLNS